jgi:excisionase family DNA binding protein
MSGRDFGQRHAQGEGPRILRCAPPPSAFYPDGEDPVMPKKSPTPCPPVQNRALTTDEVAAELHVSRRTVQVWIQTQKLVAMQFGREYRIERKDLEDFKERAKRRDR